MASSGLKKRPFWVWIISAYYILSGLSSLMAILAVQTGSMEVTPEELRSLKEQILLWSLGGVIPLLNIIAAISLFMMRKAAFYLMLGLLGIKAVNDLLQVVLTNNAEQFSSQGMIGVTLGYVISILICIYTYKLLKRGVLT